MHEWACMPDPSSGHAPFRCSAANPAAGAGVVVSIAAGNAGPRPSTVSNNAPGAITVAASTLPRAVVAVLQLGDGTRLEGGSEQSDPLGPFPLIYSGNASASGVVVSEARLCANGSLKPLVVAGKAVVSVARSEQGMTAITECFHEACSV